MPTVYGYHHVELDKVGKGKRVLKPPGGGSSDIFGSPGDKSPLKSSNQQNANGRRVSEGGAPNTQDRLFGGDSSVVGVPSGNSTPDGSLSPGRRASVDRMKSNIFSEADSVDSVQKLNAGSPRKPQPQQHNARRNPITGEIYTSNTHRNGNVNGNTNGNSNGNANGHHNVPAQRVRKPPGGESSGIF